MKIFSLYIEKYMKFEKQEVKFNSENISKYKEDFQKELFGKMNLEKGYLLIFQYIIVL